MSDLVNAAANILMGSYPEPTDWDAKRQSDAQRVRRFMGMEVVVTPNLEPDEIVIGYPDGKGGFKPGAVKGKL